MHKGFFTDVMQHRPALFATMLAFNGLGSSAAQIELAAQGQGEVQASPASQNEGQAFTAPQSTSVVACMHALSHVQGMSDAHRAMLAASPVVQRHLLASSQKNDSAPSSFWDFAEESRRLVFLSPQELTTLLHFFGVAIHAKYYAHLVRHADVVALRRALGADAYAYGLVRGRFQLGSISTFFQSRSQAIGTTGQSFDVDTILHNIARDGDVALGLCMATWPQHLQDHICTNLGRPIIPIRDADAATVRGVWFALKKLLLREVEPQWAPCFD